MDPIMASNPQLQSSFFTKLPAELRIIIYHHVLSTFHGRDSHLVNALSCCKQIYSELEHELPLAFRNNLVHTLQDVQATWTKQFPPFAYFIFTLPPDAESTTYTDYSTSLHLTLPESAFIDYHGAKCLRKVVLPSLAPFTLSDLRISYSLPTATSPSSTTPPFHPSMKWFSATPLSRINAMTTDRPNVSLRCGSRTRKFSFSIVPPGHDENMYESLVMATLMHDRFLQKCGYGHGWERVDGGLEGLSGESVLMVFWRGVWRME